MGYYFLAASLPTLSMDAPPPLTEEALLACCASELSEKDLAALKALMASAESAAEMAPCPTQPFSQAWFAADTQLRNAVARQRARRLGLDSAGAVRPHDGFDLMIESEVADAFGQGTPLDRERRLDTLRWKKLEELAGTDMFATAYILAYALKLRLATRWSGLDDEQGRQQVESMIDNRNKEQGLQA
jgi:hypothetical protein